MNSLKRNPGLLIAALCSFVLLLSGCQTTHWPQAGGQPGMTIDSAPIPESSLGDPVEFGTESDSLMFNESQRIDEQLARKPNISTKSRENTIRLGAPATESLSQYFVEDFQTDIATVQKFPVTESPTPGRNQPSSEVARDESLDLQLEDYSTGADVSQETLSPVELTGPDLPLFTESPATAGAPSLKVNIPESLSVGHPSMVTVTISELDSQIAMRSRINVRLSSELQRSGDPSREFDLNLLTPEGKLRSKVSFPLLATEPGTHSFEVSLRNVDEELSWKKVSVNAEAGLLSIALTGPQTKPLGATAEYTLNIHNRSEDSLGPVTAIVEFDGTLIPREASEGAEQKSGRLVWQFPVLHPDEQIFLQVEFECPVESAHACVTARVQAGDRPPLREQSCLKISKPTGTIRLVVEDRNDLAGKEQEMTAIVRVTNLGLQPARDVRLSLDLPDNLTYKNHTATQGNNKLELPLTDQLIQLLFEPVAELNPDQTLELQITFEATEPGTNLFQARVTDRAHTEPLTAAEPFAVTP